MVVFCELLGARLGASVHDPFGSALHAMAVYAVAGAVLFLLGRALLTGRLHMPFVSTDRSPATRLSERIASASNPGEAVREHTRSLGGGAFLGFSPGGGWVSADPEHAVMVLGPPRSGKTSTVVIPALLGAPGAAVSTATKPDVLEATWSARAQMGQVWLFDPAGEQIELPREIRRLSWSPVTAASSWDGALLMARAMAACASRRKGHDQRGALARALKRAARTAALCREPHLSTGLRAPALGAEQRPQRSGNRARGPRREDRQRRARRDRQDRRAGALLDLLRHRRSARRLQRRRTTQGRRQPELRPGPLRQLDRHDLHHRARPQAGALRTAGRRPAGADPPRHLRTSARGNGAAGPPLFLCLDEVANIAPDPRPPRPGLRGRRTAPARHGLPAGPLTGPQPLGRGTRPTGSCRCFRPS